MNWNATTALPAILIRRHRRLLVISIQLALAVVSLIASFMLANGVTAEFPLELAIQAFVLLIPLRLASMIYFRLFHGMWRYVGARDIIQITKATTVSSLVFAPLALAIFGLDAFPKRVFFIDWAGNIFLLGGVRLAARVLRERLRPPSYAHGPWQRLLIVGAGDAGAMLCNQMLASPQFRFTPVAFADDDPRKHGTTILGIPVAGSLSDIPSIVIDYRVAMIVIAIPSANSGQMQSIVELCQRGGVPFKTLPAMPDMLEEKVNIHRIRDVDLADLLGRPQAKLDHQSIRKLIAGKRILVTGAAGSVGSELARQIFPLNPELLLLVDRAENQLLLLQAELRATWANRTPPIAEIADVTDPSSVEQMMDGYRPDVVFHAAAYKHVAFMERAPVEAIKNNIGGTHVLARSAQQAAVEKFVLVSTDKAVNPTGVMGVTKRIAELMVQEFNRKGSTRFMTVRFGNVLGSSGSVIPIFKEQIARGGPVTVTDPGASRYFMSIPEAAELIMQAAAIGDGGECFVLDMGEQVRILEIAETLISLSGLKPMEDIQIVYTGLGSGEKLREELQGKDEMLEATSYDKLLIVRLLRKSEEVMEKAVDLWHLASTLDRKEIRDRLKDLVPEYHHAVEVGGTSDTVDNRASQ